MRSLNNACPPQIRSTTLRLQAVLASYGLSCHLLLLLRAKHVLLNVAEPYPDWSSYYSLSLLLRVKHVCLNVAEPYPDWSPYYYLLLLLRVESMFRRMWQNPIMTGLSGDLQEEIQQAFRDHQLGKLQNPDDNVWEA
jgi:hypothetical protein